MRQLLYSSMVAGFAGSELQGIYQLGTVGVGDVPANPPRPFMVMRQMPSTRYQTVRDTSKANRQGWQLYFYDDPGSLLRIDALLAIAELVVDGLEGVQSSSGAWCFESLWVGISQDFRDESYDAVARFATIQLSTNK